MKSKLTHIFRLGILSLGLGLLNRAQAQIDFHVSVDTSSLQAHPAGPFYIDFQLNDGSGLGDGNNAASISNVSFNGGAALANSMGGGGGMSGDLTSSVQLVDSGPLVNEFYQGFLAGTKLQFDVHLTTKIDDGPVPDIFTFTLLDSELANIPTLSGSSDLLLAVNLNQENPLIETYASDPTTGPFAGGPALSIAAPLVSTPVPEASTFGIVACGLLGLLARRRRMRSGGGRG